LLSNALACKLLINVYISHMSFMNFILKLTSEQQLFTKLLVLVLNPIFAEQEALFDPILRWGWLAVDPNLFFDSLN
jgi:hypothetical protein